MAKTVVILGGSLAGLHIAHYLLKLKIPELKVVLVSKNSHFYWNPASVRAIIPGLIKDDQILQPLKNALARYSPSSYELIIGAADATDFAAKTVTVSPLDGSGIKTIQYDHLVLATGARAAGSVEVPWKAAGTYEEIVALLRETSSRVAAANHIVVAGAGTTGVEVASELAFEYGRKKENGKEIVLLSAGDGALPGDSIAGNARSELLKLDVKIRTGVLVESARLRPDGKTEVVLQDGEVITTDLYLPTMGLIPNSDFVDRKYLNDKKLVIVDEFFRVDGAGAVWAAGDIVSKPRAGFIITQKQAAGVAKNIEAALKDKAPTQVKGMPVDAIACSIGRSRGVGRIASVKMPSIVVWLVKGRTLGMGSVTAYIDGSVA